MWNLQPCIYGHGLSIRYFSFLLFFFLVHYILTWHSFVLPEHKGDNIWGVINFLSLCRCLFCFSPSFLAYPLSSLSLKAAGTKLTLQIQSVLKMHEITHKYCIFDTYNWLDKNIRLCFYLQSLLTDSYQCTTTSASQQNYSEHDVNNKINHKVTAQSAKW